MRGGNSLFHPLYGLIEEGHLGLPEGLDLRRFVVCVGPTDDLVDVGMDSGDVVDEGGCVLVAHEPVVKDFMDRRFLIHKTYIGRAPENQKEGDGQEWRNQEFLEHAKVPKTVGHDPPLIVVSRRAPPSRLTQPGRFSTVCLFFFAVGPRGLQSSLSEIALNH